jgi:hypothetical protein
MSEVRGRPETSIAQRNGFEALLRKLSRRGALIVPGIRAPGTRQCAYLVCDGKPDETIPVALYDRARHAGIIEKLRDGSGWRLSSSGRDLVRRLVSGGLERSIVPTLGQRPGHNLDESPLAWLRRRRRKDGVALISEEQFQAGERLRADFTFAQLGPRVTANWDLALASAPANRSGAAGAGVEMADNVVAAGERVARALRAVGPELSGTLVDVCCFLKGLEDLERETGWPQRSAKVVLDLALTRLARHYGLLRDGDAASSGKRPRHWGTPDYRPSADPPHSSDQPSAD